MKVGITERGDASFHVSDLMRRSKDYDLCIWITKNPYIFVSSSVPFGLPSNVIIHCTITGYGDTILEPGVPNWYTSIESYHELVSLYGKERIILRVDPVIATDEGVSIAKKVIQHAKGRIRISFLDLYPHIRERFRQYKYNYPITTFHADIIDRVRYTDYLQSITKHEIEVCGEPDIECLGCVSERDFKAIGLDYIPSGKSYQRTVCHCTGEKTELLKDRKPCPHKCLYCYWKGNL